MLEQYYELLYPMDFKYLDFMKCALSREENYCMTNITCLRSVAGSRVRNSVKRRSLIVLMLLMSGNVSPNPGPYTALSFTTPAELKTRSGLGFIRLNVRSLLPKLDMVYIWAKNTNADVIVISESWLNKSISDKDISITGYKVFRSDRLKKGGGVAIYVKEHLEASLLLSVSIAKQYELLALNLSVSKTLQITIAGCYRPPSATSNAVQSLIHSLTSLEYKELIIMGDFNLNWMHAISDDLKKICDSQNFFSINRYTHQAKF